MMISELTTEQIDLIMDIFVHESYGHLRTDYVESGEQFTDFTNDSFSMGMRELSLRGETYSLAEDLYNIFGFMSKEEIEEVIEYVREEC
jgi:hypothetical protein